jgi:hypothetical protein
MVGVSAAVSASLRCDRSEPPPSDLALISNRIAGLASWCADHSDYATSTTETIMIITEAQVNAALRHAASFGAGAATVALTFGVLDNDTAHQAVQALNQVVDGLSQATGGLFKLTVILGPAVAAIAARFAAKSASPIAQINAVAANPDVSKVVTTPEIAKATPSDKVVAA